MRCETELRKALEMVKKEFDRSDPLDSVLNLMALYSVRYTLEWVLGEREPVVDGVKFVCRELEQQLMKSGILTKIEDSRY